MYGRFDIGCEIKGPLMMETFLLAVLSFWAYTEKIQYFLLFCPHLHGKSIENGHIRKKSLLFSLNYLNDRRKRMIFLLYAQVKNLGSILLSLQHLCYLANIHHMVILLRIPFAVCFCINKALRLQLLRIHLFTN